MNPLSGIDQILLKISASTPISNKYILNLAEEMNVNINSSINLKKKNAISLTVLSGPHIDKKSREQFCIPKYSKIFVINFTNLFNTQYVSSKNVSELQSIEHLTQTMSQNFLLFKKKVLDAGFDVSFTYLKSEKVKLL